jgi:hypothetical protein
MRKPALHVIALLVALALTASLAQSSAAGSIFYFRDSTPSEPMPNGTTTSDSFSGGLWLGRSMAGDPGASAETETVALSSTGDPAYWRMVSFVSDPLVSHVLPAGTWTLGISAMESSPSANAYLRATIFLWSTNDTKGAEIVPIQTSSTEFQTSWGDIVWALSGSETVVAQGDKLVVELAVETRGATPATSAALRWNTDRSFIETTAIPEPSTALFLALGLAGLAVRRRRLH